MSIKTAIEGVMDLVGAISGIRKAPDAPPEDMSVFPFAVAWPGETHHEYTAGSATSERLSLMTIVVQLHIARKVDLPREYATAIPYADSIPNAIMGDVTLGGTAQTFGYIDASELQVMKWGETDTIGFEFRIYDVKIRTSVT